MKGTLRSIVLTAALVVSACALSPATGTALAAEGGTPDLSVSNIAGGSIFSGLAPAVLDTADPHSVELGVRFESAVPLAIEGIRFFKGPEDSGTHVGHLWTSTGTLLASATFTSENSYGWQSVRFEKPVVIEPHTVYVASYFAPYGSYPATKFFFEHGPVVNGPVTALGGRERRLQLRPHERIPDVELRLLELLRGHHVLDRDHGRPAGDVHRQRDKRRRERLGGGDRHRPVAQRPHLDAGRSERLLDRGRNA